VRREGYKQRVQRLFGVGTGRGDAGRKKEKKGVTVLVKYRNRTVKLQQGVKTGHRIVGVGEEAGRGKQAKKIKLQDLYSAQWDSTKKKGRQWEKRTLGAKHGLS